MRVEGLLWLLLGLAPVCRGGSNGQFPRYRLLREEEDNSLAISEELDDEYAERRVLAEQYYCTPEPEAPAYSQLLQAPKVFEKPTPTRPSPSPIAATQASKERPAPAPMASKPPTKRGPFPPPTNAGGQKASQESFHPSHIAEPSICGNISSAFTVTISGPANATKCTASASLSDEGAETCQLYGKAYGDDCNVYLGGLYINIGFVNPQGTVNPDVQTGLSYLGLGNLTQIGLLHVSVGGAGQQVLRAIDFLPNLQAIIGANNPNPSNGFTGAALYLSASSGADVSALPSLTSLTGINGTTILQDLALVNLTTGLQNVQIVEGDLVVENNPVMSSLAGLAQSITTVTGQLYIANNPQLRSLAGRNVTLSPPGTLKTVGKALVIGGNALLTNLGGLESLEYVGGPITISQNTQLSNITALSHYANCASNPTSQATPVAIFVQVVIQLQVGAPPITCILNNFVSICAFIKNGGCPNPDGTPALITSGGGLGD